MAHDVAIDDQDWAYLGDALRGRKHGHGAETGRGALAGARYDGEFCRGARHGRGALWLGARAFDGRWEGGRPVRGTAVEPDGAFFLLQFDGAAGLHDDGAWRAALARAPPAAGRIAAWPPADGAPGGLGGAAEWAGAAERAADRARFDGRLRGLRPLAGTETDAGGRGGLRGRADAGRGAAAAREAGAELPEERGSEGGEGARERGSEGASGERG